jgi:6,7-dimethyl-8-ribityllumazine synthase
MIMAQTYEGHLNASGLRMAIVASRFNESIVRRLVDGAMDCLRRHGTSEDDISVAWVPGAFELPVVAQRLATSGEFDAIVAVGVVVRGETAHFDYVAGNASTGIGRVALDTGVVVTNAILTTNTVEQATERAGGKAGNKGFEAALAAIEMANLSSSLPKPRGGL